MVTTRAGNLYGFPAPLQQPAPMADEAQPDANAPPVNLPLGVLPQNAGNAGLVPYVQQVPNLNVPGPPSLSQGSEGVGPGHALHQEQPVQQPAHPVQHQGGGGAPPKDAFSIPKFRGEPSELPHTASILNRFSLYFNCLPWYNAGPMSWQRRSAALALSAFPPGSAAAVWFEQLLPNLHSYEQFVTEFRDRFVSSGVDLLTLQEKWQNAKQRGSDSVSSYYTFLLRLQAQINALGGDVTSDQLFLRMLYGLQPALLERIKPHVMLWAPAQQTPNNLKSLAETFSTKPRAAPPAPAAALNATVGPKKFSGKKQKFCFFCKSREHSHESCPRIAAKKAAGTWEDRPRAQ